MYSDILKNSFFLFVFLLVALLFVRPVQVILYVVVVLTFNCNIATTRIPLLHILRRLGNTKKFDAYDTTNLFQNHSMTLHKKTKSIKLSQSNHQAMFIDKF